MWEKKKKTGLEKSKRGVKSGPKKVRRKMESGGTITEKRATLTLRQHVLKN